MNLKRIGRGNWIGQGHVCSHPIQILHIIPSKFNITKQEPRPKFTQFKTISRFIFPLFPSLFLIPSPFILRFIFPPLFPFLALRHTGLNRTKPIRISFSLFKFSLFYKGFPASYPFLISALPQVL